MKLVRDFRAPTDQAKADELRRQLIQFEQNVSDVADALAQSKMAKLRVKKRITNRDTETVGPGQSLGIVYTVARVQLDPPQPGDAGKFLAICKGYGPAANTDIFAPTNSLINGQASVTLGVSGLLLLVYCDGVDYWANVP